jgi:hypothetical protein
MSADEPKDTAAYLRLWIEQSARNAQYIPQVQRALEQAGWQNYAIQGGRSFLSPDIIAEAEASQQSQFVYVRKNMPLPPALDAAIVAGLGITLTSGSSMFFGAVRAERDAGRVSAEAATPILTAYQQLEDEQNRVADARSLLSASFPAVVAQLDRAAAVYQQSKSQPGVAAAAALEIRTLLDKLKGELFATARRHEREDMTWQTMVERLQRPTTDGTVTAAVAGQNKARTDVIGALSDIAKRRTDDDRHKLSELWIMALDHIAIMCGYVVGGRNRT